jgi:hypothetical protein
VGAVPRVAALVGLVVVVLAAATFASAALDRPATTVHEELVIAAPRQLVWQLLTDFKGYEDWNPFITRAEGAARIGATVRLRLEPQSGGAEDVESEVLDVKVLRKLRWRSRKYVPGLLDEEHTFRVLPLGPDRVRLVYLGRFEGLLQPFADLEERKRGYERMVRALRDRALRG